MKGLAPEHHADLRKSGLTDDTITLLGCKAVRPHDIKIAGVESAYDLVYHDLNGQPNCFRRTKLFPPVTHADGSIQKYDQPQGTAPQFYMPPLFSWAAVAKNPKCDILITEGEKKSAAMCERGLFCAAVAGVWNWGTTLDSGERLTILTLDQFVWQNRRVELIPDSDVWRPDKQHALWGFYALGQELISRGATVVLVKLPEPHGGKVGLDDWLVHAGGSWERDWPALERIALDDDRLASVAAWWQRWREKQATHQAIKQRDADDLTLTEVAGLYTVRSSAHAVVMTFDRLTDTRGGISAEVTITLGSTELITCVDVGLKSDTSQTKLASSLKIYAAAIPWAVLLRKACGLVMRRHRRGEPPARLNRHTMIEPLTYAVNPLVPRRKASILFADGGKGKSTLALMLAMSVATGTGVAGFSALKGRALYLDWEDDLDVHARRLQAIRAGHPELDEADIQYQRCCEPLTKSMHDLVRTIQKDQITFVVVDSLLASMGGDASAEAVGKFFAAIRLFQTETLLIGHTPKTIAEGQEHATVYGSVFNQNFARSVWELKTEQEVGDNSAILGLFHRKSNLMRKHPPIGLQVTHNPEGTFIQYESFDLTKTTELVTALPLPNQIRTLLEKDGLPRTSQQIADELGAKLGSVKTTLSNPRYKGFKWSLIGEGKDSRWTTLQG